MEFISPLRASLPSGHCARDDLVNAFLRSAFLEDLNKLIFVDHAEFFMLAKGELR